MAYALLYIGMGALFLIYFSIQVAENTSEYERARMIEWSKDESMFPSLKNNAGFTLIELLITFVIIAILAAFAIPAYSTYKDNARVAAAQGDLKRIQLAIATLATDTELWPGPQAVGVITSQEISPLDSTQAGLTRAADDGDGNYTDFPNWKGPYLQSLPKDPWGSPYFFDSGYNISGTDVPVVGSFGPNLGSDDDVDIILPTK